MKTLQNIKKYVVWFIIWVALVSWVTYGASNGSIGALFTQISGSWVLPGQHIQNGTVTPNKIDVTGNYTMNQLTATDKVEAVSWAQSVRMDASWGTNWAHVRAFGGSNAASLRALSDSIASVFLWNSWASGWYRLEYDGSTFKIIRHDNVSIGTMLSIQDWVIKFWTHADSLPKTTFSDGNMTTLWNIKTVSWKIEAASAKFTWNAEAQAFLYTSDKRLKDNIETIQDPLQKVQALRGVTWNWKKDGKADVGFIAQEVEQVLPELVATKDDGYKAVQYANLVWVLVEAVKEQQKQIDALTAKVEALETK